MFRHIGQWNRIDSPETNPCTYEQLIFDKGVKRIQQGKNSLFNNWISMCNKMKLNPYFMPYTKINPKLDLNVKAKTMKLLEENTEVNLCDLGQGNFFLDMIPKEQITKEQIE